MTSHSFASTSEPHFRPAHSLVSLPYLSRRFGWTIRINPLGQEQKACSYNCAYCSLGPTTLRLGQMRENIRFPSVEDILGHLRQAIEGHITHDNPIQTLSLQGYGEPTLAPQFPELVEALILIRNEMLPDAKINLISNGMQFDKKKVKQAALRLDQVVLKVDAGSDELLKKINSPLIRVNADGIAASVRSFQKLAVQAYFVSGPLDNTTNTAIEDWMELVGMIAPQIIYISTFHGPTTLAKLEPAPEDRLFHIAQRLQRKARYEVSVIA